MNWQGNTSSVTVSCLGYFFPQIPCDGSPVLFHVQSMDTEGFLLLPCAEFRETRAAQDFFATCRSPEKCCELTLQVRWGSGLEFTRREGWEPVL